MHTLSSGVVLVLALAVGISARAQAFGVDFFDCTEFAGQGPVAMAAATALVPEGFTASTTAGGQGSVVIRATSCASIAVDRAHAMPTNISQIGVNIVSPNGTGDINNYTNIYVSNNPFLVEAFLRAGLPAQFDPALTYEFTTDSTGVAGELYVAAGSPFLTRYFIYGRETNPAPNSGGPFLANWWYKVGRGKLLEQTLLPDISFGTSSVVFYTSSSSVLGKLIGGNTFGNFSILALRGVYPGGHMDVTVGH